MARGPAHFLLYPDRQLTPFLERNTLDGPPPAGSERLFVMDRHGRWHFGADLSTRADVEAQLKRIGVDAATRDAVLELWRTTFAHHEFTGRSDRFFMFEGLGSVFWHMTSKFLLAVQASYLRARDPEIAADLARYYDEAREGLGSRKTPDVFGAFPVDPHSHSPRHRGAQQPGMTGQAKEDILIRFGELGVEARDGRLRFEPRLLHRDELLDTPYRFACLDHRRRRGDVGPARRQPGVHLLPGAGLLQAGGAALDPTRADRRRDRGRGGHGAGPPGQCGHRWATGHLPPPDGDHSARRARGRVRRLRAVLRSERVRPAGPWRPLATPCLVS